RGTRGRLGFSRHEGEARAGARGGRRGGVRRQCGTRLDGGEGRHGSASAPRVATRLRRDEGQGTWCGAREALRSRVGAGDCPESPNAGRRRLSASARGVPGEEARLQEGTASVILSIGRYLPTL